MRKTRSVLFLVTAALLLCAVVASADESQPRGITVTGYGEAKAKPDVAYLSVGVSTEAKNAGAAAGENARKTDSVIAALTRTGVPKADIETQRYSVEPNYQYPSTGVRTLVGYIVSNTVKVTLRDLAKVGQVIDAGLAAGANNVQGVQFALQNTDQISQQALAKAVQNAQAKAEVIANALHRPLGPVISVTESGGAPPRPYDFAFAKAAEAAPPTPIIPGDVEANASVTTVYSIGP